MKDEGQNKWAEWPISHRVIKRLGLEA